MTKPVRTRRVVILVSPEEWSAWQKAAERQYLTVSELIRKSVNESIERSPARAESS